MTNLTQTFSHAKEEAGAAIDHAGDAIKSGLACTKNTAAQTLGTIETQVAKHPHKALGIAVLAGMAVACLMTIRRHESASNK